uniref:DNA topoisomerase n=1 Tax=Oryza punctata TaxID=4537 RepID=A0A0E0JZS3_ORYPU
MALQLRRLIPRHYANRAAAPLALDPPPPPAGATPATVIAPIIPPFFPVATHELRINAAGFGVCGERHLFVSLPARGWSSTLTTGCIFIDTLCCPHLHVSTLLNRQLSTQLGVSQRYSYTFMPYSPFRLCEMCGVSVSNNSSRQLSSISPRPPVRLKSGSFLTGLMSNHNFVSSRATYSRGISLRPNNIGNSWCFLTVCNKNLSFLIRNKSLFGNPNMRREEGSDMHNLFHRSEKKKSTLPSCSIITDEASTSTSNHSKSAIGTENSSTSRIKDVSEDKKVSTKKQSKSAKTSIAAAKTGTTDANQEQNKHEISKSEKIANISGVKKASNKLKNFSKAKKSAAAKAEICTKSSVDSSGSEQKPLVPLYPPTAKSVLVVESVTKAKVIQKYLGNMYEVLPSYGHVRNLAGRSKSVRPDDDFSMVWEVPAAAWTHLKSIRMALRGAENLILASDPDREGEAIAWHIKEMLERQDALGCNVTVARVVFHEITEDAVKKALMSPRYIDMNLINAYLAQRSLDYLIGFGISPLLWRKLPGCQSAGRVQFAALALLCDREAEIEQFNPQEYWTIDTDFKTQHSGPSNGLNLQARIKHLNSKMLDQLSIWSQEEAHDIEKRIYSSQFEVIGIKRSKIHKNPPMPYITSSLQQDAANKLHFSAGYTMKVVSSNSDAYIRFPIIVAQKLYEGITLSSEDTTGLITYIRTDGFHISDGAAEDILSLVKQRYGEEYASEGIRKYFKKMKNAQETHEAIRPTSIRRLPSSLVSTLDDDSLKLYDLIWKRTMACQMEASRAEMIQVDIGNSKGDMIFHSSASNLDFKGYQAVYDDTEASPSSNNSEDDAVHQDNFEALSKLKVKDLMSPVNVHLAQHFTKPPSRYYESALIKRLEELGIGGPSTYSSIMKDRNHVTVKGQVVHPEFRGRMLDNVSAGSTEWKDLLKDFWERFNEYCVNASRLQVRKVERMLEEKFGSILFPDLDNDSRICPSCSEGTLRLKVSRHGEGYFIGCDQHLKCKYIARTLSVEVDETEGSDEIPSTFTPRLLGVLPDSDEKVFLKQGPYGYYIQVGEDRKGVSRKRAPLCKVKDIDSITLEDAIELLQYPKILGKHPDDDLPVLVTHSKAGFRIRHRRTLAPLPKSADPKEITLERALKLLTGKNVKRFGRPKGIKNEEPLEYHW